MRRIAIFLCLFVFAPLGSLAVPTLAKADTVEVLASGFNNSYRWTVDHDETTGTIGVTVTDNGSPRSGTLLLHAEVLRDSNGQVVFTIAPIEIVQYDNQGRQVLFTNSQLVGQSLSSLSSTFGLEIWTTFQPT